MTQQKPAQPESAMTSTQLWAAYERQVIATATAWHDYEVLACKADEALKAYQEHNRRRNELYDAYWATHDRAA